MSLSSRSWSSRAVHKVLVTIRLTLLVVFFLTVLAAWTGMYFYLVDVPNVLFHQFNAVLMGTFFGISALPISFLYLGDGLCNVTDKSHPDYRTARYLEIGWLMWLLPIAMRFAEPYSPLLYQYRWVPLLFLPVSVLSDLAHVYFKRKRVPKPS